jgi:hypothetical protein
MVHKATSRESTKLEDIRISILLSRPEYDKLVQTALKLDRSKAWVVRQCLNGSLDNIT